MLQGTSQQIPAQAAQSTAVPGSSAKSLTPAKLPDAGSTEKPAAAPNPDASGAVPVANAVETRLRSELARLELSDKVKLQVTSNGLTLSGQVTPAEHLMLLNRLHWVPARVRLIDDLEYSSDIGQTPGAASVGWVWIRSEPQGAEIRVDNTDTGLRTPARVQMAQGEHRVRLALKGFLDAQRTVAVRLGQTIQFTEALAQQQSQ
jgi:hypothetical protein